MSEQPIILRETDGRIDTSVAHLVAPYAPDRRRFPNLNTQFAPCRWWALCGVQGQVYVRGGSLEHTPECDACRAAAEAAA